MVYDWTEKQESEVIRLLNEGTTPKNVSKKLGIPLTVLYARTSKLRRDGVEVRKYQTDPTSKDLLSLEHYVFLRDHTGTLTEKVRAFFDLYPDIPVTLLTVVGLATHRNRIEERIKILRDMEV